MVHTNTSKAEAYYENIVLANSMITPNSPLSQDSKFADIKNKVLQFSESIILN